MLFLDIKDRNMDRSQFFELLTRPATKHLNNTGSLDPYTGPWTQTQAMHLLRRTCFGFTPHDLQDFVDLGLSEAVETLLDQSAPQPAPPVNVYATPDKPDPNAGFGQTWVNAPYNPALPVEYYQARTDSLKAWWVGLMIHSPLNIREKMTLFWQNHFAIEADVVEIAQAMYWYLSALRSNCLGNFKTLTKTITIDPAMLRYLNGYLNSKGQPDENYARELQELFTVGKGPDSQYTEDDIKAAARILTGLRINPFTSPISYFFDFTQHDTGNKSFSAFYGNKTIVGKIGQAGETEVNELLDMIFSNHEVSKFICRKLYQFFVYYDITPEIEQNIILPLATIFRTNNYEIYPVVETLIKSEHFYHELNMGCIIKSPLDFVAGLSRTFNFKFPDPQTQLQSLYLSWALIAANAAQTGLNVLDPPLVAGYPAWHQAPLFTRVWINSDSLANRLVLINNLCNGQIALGDAVIVFDPLEFIRSLPAPADPNQLVSDTVDFLYGLPVGHQTRDYFKSFLLSGLDDFYWTNLWNQYLLEPGNQEYQNAARFRILSMLREMMQQAEFNLI